MADGEEASFRAVPPPNRPASDLRPVSALFPPGEERRRVDDLLTQELLAAGARVAAGPVTPTIDLGAFRDDLAGFDFAEEQSATAALAWVIAQLEGGVTHI